MTQPPHAAGRRYEAVLLSGCPVGQGERDRAADAGLAVVDAEPAGGVEPALARLWDEGVAPDDVLVLSGAADAAAAVEAQLRLRADRALPAVDPPAGWRWDVPRFDVERERVDEALLAVADGVVGVTGAPLADHLATRRTALVGGVYEGEGAESHLLSAPVALAVAQQLADPGGVQRVLDLRTGVLAERETTTTGDLAAVRFASLDRPGTVALRATGVRQGPTDLLLPPPSAAAFEHGHDDGVSWVREPADGGAVVVACTARGPVDAGGASDRFAVYAAEDGAGRETVVAAVREAAETGFDRLLADSRRRWAARWAAADVSLSEQPDLTTTVRLMLFHLMAGVPDTGEAAIGPRGLTGLGYRGHVFWDTDVFALPFLAATHPASARAVLEYRVRRIGAAQQEARARGHAGARFPWESAASGRDVTPTSAYDRLGRVIAVRTGALEEHVVADVAWAAATYLDWTGDAAFAADGGRRLLVETARYWASRLEVDDDGSAHLRGVIGPDEYHEDVDDNAFTNVMARWNLRRAAAAVGARSPGGPPDDVPPEEVARWRDLADAVVDGYDPATRRHEQFTGFDDLEPIVIAEVVPRRPVAADVLMGRDRVRTTQVVKQPDVLMLHHLLPDEMPSGSFEADLAHYEPRTAHGSSLSPGVHAALLARAGRLGPAQAAFEIAAHIDTDDLTGTTAAGVHVATAGSMWQALVQGFAGVRPCAGRLRVDPHVPPAWGTLDVRVRYRGRAVRVRCSADDVDVRADGPVPVTVAGTDGVAGPHGVRAAPSPEETT